MDLLSLYIRPEAFILIPTLYFLGLILEQTPAIPKWMHAWIKLLFAVVSCLIYFAFDIRAVVQGVLVTGGEMVLRDVIDNIFSKKRKKAR